MDMREAFTRAYKDGQWYHGSGSGSEPQNTFAWRCFLRGFMQKLRVESVLDIGSGDWKCMGLLPWGQGVRTCPLYYGIEVVPEVFASTAIQNERSGVWFLEGDALAMDWPDADLVVVKDVLQHWPDDSIQALWARLEDRPHVLVVTDLEGPRPLDLRQAPFCWPIHEVFRYPSQSWPGGTERIDTKIVLGW